MSMVTVVILDEHDACGLLRTLYNGPRPERVHILICLCGNFADLRRSPKAWNGWQVLPTPKCPCCLQLPRQDARTVSEYAGHARQRFDELMKNLTKSAWKEGKS